MAGLVDALCAALGVRMRFLGEHQEEDDIVSSRNAAITRAAVENLIRQIEAEGQKRDARRLQIREEKERIERRRSERHAL